MQSYHSKSIQDVRKYDAFRDRADAIFDQLLGEINGNISLTEKYLSDFAAAYPALHRSAATQKAARMLLANEKKYVRLLAEDGILSEKDAAHIENDIDSVQLKA